MDNLPVLVVRQISDWLLPTDIINLALTCRRLLYSIADYPQSSFLRVSVSNCPSRGSFSKGETSLVVCQCPHHGTTDLMRDMLPLLFKGVNSLELEDDLVREKMTDDVVFAVLTKFANVSLTRLVLSRCDLSNVHPWTLSLIANMEQLRELVVDSCQLPVSESLFLRSIEASFPTLVNVELTRNNKVTDNMALVLSRNCHHLESLTVTGCPLVTVRSLLHLMSSIMLRLRPILTVNLEKTAFCADQLFRYMNSPLFEGLCSDWIVRRTSVDLGFEKRALLAEHIKSLCIVVYD